MTAPLLSISDLHLSLGGRLILSRLDLELSQHGLYVLMGPGGAGKSTLLRLLAGHLSDHAQLETRGEITYRGESLHAGTERPALVGQNARAYLSSVLEGILTCVPERANLTACDARALARRLLVHTGLVGLLDQLERSVCELSTSEQRQLSIARAVAANPSLVMVDEPTAGLDTGQSGGILELLRIEAARRAVLVVTHNQEHAQILGGTVLFLAGGFIREHAPASRFFTAPSRDTTKVFVRTGGCAVPSPASRPEDLDPAWKLRGAETVEPEPSRAVPEPDVPGDYLGPSGFHWLVQGHLAGTPAPGLLRDAEGDFRALQRVGVTTLISLVESEPRREVAISHGMDYLHFPVADMRAPRMLQAVSLCNVIEDRLERGCVVCLHCKAGLGRTGVALATWLVWRGSSASAALAKVRSVEPRWVQSEEQVEFLDRFEEYCNLVRMSSGV